MRQTTRLAALPLVVVIAIVAFGRTSIARDVADATTPAPDHRPGSEVEASSPPGVQPTRPFDVARDAPVDVALYADSLGFEAADTIAGSLGPATRFERFAAPGSALCDLVSLLGEQPDRRPEVAIVQYSGNDLTSCIRDRPATGGAGDSVVARYAADAEAAVSVLRSRGAAVFLAGSPRSEWTARASELDGVYAGVAARWALRGEPVFFIDSGRSVLAPDGSFASRLPCRESDRWAGACDGDGRVQVRSADGTHFCPIDTGGFSPCPVWSSGAHRFGVAIAEAVRDELDLPGGAATATG
jgi:hypothetical protein